MDSHKQECLSFVQDFKEGTIVIEWKEVFAHEEYQEHLNDSLTNLIYHLSLLKGLDEKTKTELVGSIVIQQAEMARAITFGLEKEFMQTAAKLDATLKKMISSGTWMKEASDRFGLLDELQDAIEKAKITAAQADSLVPVLLLLETASIINCDQESDDEEDDECCDE